jgi:hypothetical protein
MAQSSHVNGDQPNAWIFDPVGSAVQFLIEEHVLVGLIERTFVTMAGVPTYLKFTATHPLVQQIDPAARARFSVMEAMARDTAAFIEQPDAHWLERVYAHHLVSLWAATETCIETTLQNCYLHIEGAHEIARAHGHSSAKPAASAWEARNFVRGWRSKLNNMPETKIDETLFKAFGIQVAFTTEDIERAEEVSEIRNCLIHNRGIASLHLLRKCSRLQTRWQEGDEIRLARTDCEDTYDLCGRILQCVANSIVASGHLRARRSK